MLACKKQICVRRGTCCPAPCSDAAAIQATLQSMCTGEILRDKDCACTIAAYVKLSSPAGRSCTRPGSAQTPL
jgi:hypothetical protein